MSESKTKKIPIRPRRSSTHAGASCASWNRPTKRRSAPTEIGPSFPSELIKPTHSGENRGCSTAPSGRRGAALQNAARKSGRPLGGSEDQPGTLGRLWGICTAEPDPRLSCWKNHGLPSWCPIWCPESVFWRDLACSGVTQRY